MKQEVKMSKKQISEALSLASQTLPFIMITATFIGLAYTYGNVLTPYPIEDSFEFARLGYNDLIRH